ncbi:uncharacterized protein K452DRAFT_236245 [Aplosporella prunicola CBS 121167]|uniref:Btz domain-containing protein n=1 Tax=Aplosporella prunicola CBS 121167 TaxID=1176127 RepID=A0A6A6B2L6_9PEZI|nr:uncharacterized protein K452DRAFT_236245 [Aplosporella prunicola CBS 121167]KAF2137257.1 hypothetical protein K452DRAFT_236245 [Aplosporella prunicola CBS 121167]
MAPPRRRDLLRRRRRDAEEDEGATERADESQSEASLLSDEDADADASDLSDAESVATRNGHARRSNGRAKAPEPASTFAPMADTEAMMNGLDIGHDDDGVDFEALGGEAAQEAPAVARSAPAQPAGAKQETMAERRRREHEEYKKKRDEDPAFIPNRGAFFMHDHRSAGANQNGFRPYGRGRGRGRGSVGGPFSPASVMAREAEATSAPWTHDLHQTLEEPQPQSQPAPVPKQTEDSSQQLANPPAQGAKPQPQTPPVKSFSSTKHIGNARIRVSIPGMKAPIYFSAVPIKEYTRLPNHRPPLRRDKPVRISLPEQPPRYIFPATERSFIFIPRALRPNQQGFGRGRGRFGSYGGFSSRRTSAYGGSIYSPSVALSRRSSLAREYRGDGIVSPAGSVMSRPPGGPMDNRPVVRLPGANYPGSGPPSQPASVHGGGTPVVNMPPQQGYPLPQRPAYRENWAAPLTMHQPKPQKTVSVAGIESPASLAVHAPQQQEQQPFHQQVPTHMNGQDHNRQASYPSQASTGTPLSNIPERAIHAQPFQPYPTGYQPQPFGTTFYYPAPTAAPQYPPGAVVPMFMPGPQQGAYPVPTVATTVPAPAPPGAPAQGNMVAHESNGMVYYYDPSQMYAPVEGYAPASYTVPGMGGMMTPSPDGYYYPQVPQAGMVYYPTQ